MEKADLKSEEAYYTGVNSLSFRRGEQAKIIGVEMITPIDKDPRPCYKVEYDDGFIDYKVISDLGCYKISTSIKEMINIDGVEYELNMVKKALDMHKTMDKAINPEEPKEEKKEYVIEYDKHSYIVESCSINNPTIQPVKNSSNAKHGRYRKTEKNAEYSLKRNQRANRLEALVENLQCELRVGEYNISLLGCIE